MTLKALYNEEEFGCEDTVEVQVFQDHLARDTHNFLHYKYANNDPTGYGLQLADDSRVPGYELTCSSAAVHAAFGYPGSAANVIPNNYYNAGEYAWDDFTSQYLIRGDVLELKVYNSDVEETNFIHWATVKDDGYGQSIYIYSADSTSHKFRHEHVASYFLSFWEFNCNEINNPDWCGDHEYFIEWLEDRAYVRIYWK